MVLKLNHLYIFVLNSVIRKIFVIGSYNVASEYGIFLLLSVYTKQQVAQLSQRDRSAGLVSYGQKWKSGTGRQLLQTL